MTILQNDAKSFVALFCYFLFFEYFCFFDLCHSFLLSCTLVKWSLVQHTRTDWCGRCEKATLALTGNRSPCLILLPPSLLVPLCILHHKSAVAASLFIWSQLKYSSYCPFPSSAPHSSLVQYSSHVCFGRTLMSTTKFKGFLQGLCFVIIVVTAIAMPWSSCTVQGIASSCLIIFCCHHHTDKWCNALQFLQEGARIQAQLTLSLTTLAKTKEKYEKVVASYVIHQK